jgi:Putative peptidoglycan binding domain
VADLTFYDAAFPPADPPATDGVVIYIGGDAVHVWSLEEIGMQPARYRLPVFVRSNPPGPGAAADVTAALTRLRQIGAPLCSLVAWDLETAADPAYIREVTAGILGAGYVLIVYGSESTVRGNDAPDGLYWGADWTSVPHLHRGDAMTQYVSFSGFDESLASPSLPFWDTQGHTPPVKGWTAAMIADLPEVRKGDTGDVVRTVQALCAARGHATAMDGVFGPATATSVAAVQRNFGLAADSVVGVHTWPVLVTGRPA